MRSPTVTALLLNETNVLLFLTDYSLDFNGSVNNNENITAAGGRSTDYLDLARKGGGHKG